MPLKRNYTSVTGVDGPRATLDYFSASSSEKQCSTSKRRRFQRATALNQVPASDEACQQTLEEYSSEDEDVDRVISGLQGTDFGQASYQRSHEGCIVQYNDAGDNTYTCSYCTALFWSTEALKKKRKKSIHIYSLL